MLFRPVFDVILPEGVFVPFKEALVIRVIVLVVKVPGQHGAVRMGHIAAVCLELLSGGLVLHEGLFLEALGFLEAFLTDNRTAYFHGVEPLVLLCPSAVFTLAFGEHGGMDVHDTGDKVDAGDFPVRLAPIGVRLGVVVRIGPLNHHMRVAGVFLRLVVGVLADPVALLARFDPAVATRAAGPSLSLAAA